MPELSQSEPNPQETTEVGPGRYFFFVIMCLVVLAGMIFFSLRIPPPPPPPEIKADPVLARGYDVYMRQCVACHGLQGKGDGPRALATPVKPRNLVDEEWKYGEDEASVTKIVREGGPNGVMPAFGTVLNPGELKAVVKYVRQFRKRPEAPPVASN
jgi:mono/diheme cytochrome c family protein